MKQFPLPDWEPEVTDLTPESERWRCPYAGSKRMLGRYRCTPPFEAAADGWKEDIVEAHSREGAVAIYRQYSKPHKTDALNLAGKPIDYTYGDLIRCPVCQRYQYWPSGVEIHKEKPCDSCLEDKQKKLDAEKRERETWFFKAWEKKNVFEKVYSVSMVFIIGYIYFQFATIVKYGIYKISGHEGTYYEYLQDEGEFWDGQYR